MIWFILVYVGIGAIVAWGWNSAMNDSIFAWCLSVILWPMMLTFKSTRDAVYIGLSGDVESAKIEYIEEEIRIYAEKTIKSDESKGDRK